MQKISYSIGPNPRKKNCYTLYLWRSDKNGLHMVAKFMNHTIAETFAKDFAFPLSDSVKRILNTPLMSAMGGDE